MAKFIKGDVVVFQFPFSDLSGSKLRPALILAKLKGNDALLCQITSQPAEDAISLTNQDFISGSLPVDSYIRPTKLFAADQSIFIRKAGNIKAEILNKAIQNVIEILKK